MQHEVPFSDLLDVIRAKKLGDGAAPNETATPFPVGAGGGQATHEEECLESGVGVHRLVAWLAQPFCFPR